MKTFEKIKLGWLIFFSIIALVIWGIEVFWVSWNLTPIFQPLEVHGIAYAFIIFCFITSLIFVDKNADRIFQAVALLFTCCADYLLIYLRVQDHGQKTLAMAFFLVAQIAYALRTWGFATSKREKIVNLSLRVGLSLVAAVVTAIVLKGDEELPLFILSVVYYVNLLLSIVFSFMHAKEGAHVWLTAIGLTLFACCDISIGFTFLIDIFSFGPGNFIYDLMHSGVDFVSLFYPPSQALLAISSYCKRKEKTAV